MEITWYGQAAFGLRGADGTVIVTDPYDPARAGYRDFPEPADIVIKSSSNDDYHDQDHLVPKKPGAVVIDALELAQGLGRTSTHGIPICAIEAMEHDDHPSGHPDQNAMYRFTLDDMDIGHMGDMGNDFSDAQMAFFEDLDVLICHAGGFPVISLEEAVRIIETVKPRLVIPMHFRTLVLRPQGMHWISEFVEMFGEGRTDFAASHTISIKKADLPQTTCARVLAYR